MIKNFLLILVGLCISQVSLAQSHRFTYQYQFRVDSTSTDSLKVEWMNLDVDKEGSVYYSQSKLKEDSINLNSIIAQYRKTPGNYSITNYTKSWSIKYVVKKEYPDFKTIWETSIMHTGLSVEEKNPQHWKILPETKTIENLTCQKATTEFGGCSWEAWFTTEIPIQDGPYKFYGLPGLIVKLTDHTKTHKFLLKGNTKLSDDDFQFDDVEKLKVEAYGGGDKNLVINRKQYKKLWKEYLNDPVKDQRQEYADPNMSIVIEKGGKRYTDKAEILKMQEDEAKERLAKNNNPIELDLHQSK